MFDIITLCSASLWWPRPAWCPSSTWWPGRPWPGQTSTNQLLPCPLRGEVRVSPWATRSSLSVFTPQVRSDWSILIGRAPALVRSHWSRASLVMLPPAVSCHKEQARASKAPYLGPWNASLLLVFCLLLAGSLCQMDSWLTWTERSNNRRPYAIKNQRGESKKTLDQCRVTFPSNWSIYVSVLLNENNQPVSPQEHFIILNLSIVNMVKQMSNVQFQ